MFEDTILNFVLNIIANAIEYGGVAQNKAIVELKDSKFVLTVKCEVEEDSKCKP